MSDEMRAAIARQIDHGAASAAVDRRGWTRAQWVEDAERLMDDIDGAVTSLVNGHVMALIEEVTTLRASGLLREDDGLRERVEALARYYDDTAKAKHRDGQMCCTRMAQQHAADLRVLVLDPDAACSTCGGTGRVDSEPGAEHASHVQQPCPDCAEARETA